MNDRAVPAAPSAATPAEGVRATRWYQEGVIYQVHLRAFRDANGDGIGDLRGLIQRLDYLQDLGITALWILPFYPSPLRDDGYDIADYMAVHPDYGTIDDVKELVAEAHRRGLRIITELVCNHTSDQHAWFQRARRAPPGSPERDFYVWSDTTAKYADARIIFKDFEVSNWTWDPVAGAYYWHRFYSHQPDLNFDNPAVKQAVKDALDFWFDLGIDGLRLDAIPYLFEREGTSCENLPETHAFLRELRAHVDAKYTDRMLLAEANQWPEDAAAYFGKGDECHMAFHFPLMPRLYLSLHAEDRFPIVDTLAQTPAIPEGCQWTVFLRNHDELTLEMVTEEERDVMYRAYAKDDRARINLGIRRRLAPLLNNNRRRIELLHALLFSMPGTPVMYYGDEIGMGDNIWLGDRNGVRTPMQWTPGLNAGFSEAPRQRLFLPVVVEPEYHFESVNVETQQQNPQSLLWWLKRLIALQQRTAAMGRGSMQLLPCDNPHILAYLRALEPERVLVVANLSRFAQHVTLDLSEHRGLVPVEMLGRTEFPAVGEAPYVLTMGPHSWFWFSLEPARSARPVKADAGPPTLTLRGPWPQELTTAARPVQQAMGRFIRHQPWFRGRPDEIRSVKTLDVVPLAGEVHLVLAEVGRVDHEPEVFALPIGRATGAAAERLLAERPGSVLLRLPGDQGVLHDACSDEATCGMLVDAVATGLDVKGAHGSLRGRPEPGATAKARSPGTPRPTQRLRTVVVGQESLLRIVRRVESGPSPEAEMLRALAERGYTKAPRLLGTVEHVTSTGGRATVALLETYVHGDGDAFSHVVEAAGQLFERVGASGAGHGPPPVPSAGRHPLALLGARPPAELPELVLAFLRGVGAQVAELHEVLARPSEHKALAPQPYTPFYQRSLYQSLRNVSGAAIRRARRFGPGAEPHTRAALEGLVAAEPRLLDQARALFERRIAATTIRCHGSLDLRHVIRIGAGVSFVDFDGPPNRTLEERRLKRNGLRDVAALIRSLQDATMTALTKRSVRPIDVDPLLPWARAFWSWGGAALLEGYLAAAPSGLAPATLEDRRLVLDVHVHLLGLQEVIDRIDAGAVDGTWRVVDGLLATLEAT